MYSTKRIIKNVYYESLAIIRLQKVGLRQVDTIQLNYLTYLESILRKINREEMKIIGGYLDHL